MKINIFLVLSAIIILYGCAKQTSPTGGPKDEAPPLLISSNPEDQSVNFKGESITLVFDEYIKLNNPNQQVLITPRLDQRVNYSFRRNRVILEFEEPLEENTTYNFNFRESIQDITENNPAEVTLAISTGTYLDSLKISGNVYNLLQGTPVSNAVIGLQLPSDTSYYFQDPPLYFARSDKNGNFTFYNLKASTYRLYAFIDTNNDLKLQPTRETHGFLQSPIVLSKDTSEMYIPLVNINTDSLKLVSARQAGRYFDINFNKYITDYSVQFSGNQKLPHMLSEDRKAIRIFNTSTLSQPLTLNYTAQDSLELTVSSEVQLTYEDTRRDPLPFSMKPNEVRLFKTNPQLDTRITFSKPIDRILTDSLYLYIDSLNILPITEDFYTFDSSRTTLIINHALDRSLFPSAEASTTPTTGPSKRTAGKPPHLYLGKGAFISVENDSSNQQSITLKQYEESALGILHIEVDVPYQYFIIELMNSRSEIITRVYNETQYTFRNLIPGTYYIRILEDSDNDGSWEPGNIFWNLPPDDALFYFNPDHKKDIVIRANWEVGPERIGTDVNNQMN